MWPHEVIGNGLKTGKYVLLSINTRVFLKDSGEIAVSRQKTMGINRDTEGD